MAFAFLRLLIKCSIVDDRFRCGSFARRREGFGRVVFDAVGFFEREGEDHVSGDTK